MTSKNQFELVTASFNNQKETIFELVTASFNDKETTGYELVTASFNHLLLSVHKNQEEPSLRLTSQLRLWLSMYIRLDWNC